MKCAMCGRAPSQIDEYLYLAESGEYGSPDLAVKYEEGTYHPAYDKFLCTRCYVEAGHPLISDVYELYMRQEGSGHGDGHENQ